MKKLAVVVLTLVVMLFGCSSNSNTSKEVPLEISNVGVMTGTTGDTYITNSYPKAKVRRFENINDAMVALIAGKLDYVCTSYSTATNFAKHNSDIEITGETVVDESIAIAVAKNNPDIFIPVSEALEKLRADGVLEQMESNWIRSDGSDYVREAIPVSTSEKVLTVGVAANREPLCFIENNKFSGLDIELISRIAYELDMQLEVVDMQFSSLMPALISGKIDLAISNLTRTNEREKVVDFTDDYLENPQVLIVKKIN